MSSLIHCIAERRSPSWPASASSTAIESAERRLGFALPALLRDIYIQIANGGFGPALLVGVGDGYLDSDGPGDLVAIYEYDRRVEPRWPAKMIRVANWGCAEWSCVDAASADGTMALSLGDGLYRSRRCLETWLSDWLDGADIPSDEFEPAPPRIGINPFTREPTEFKARGPFRGEQIIRWSFLDQ